MLCSVKFRRPRSNPTKIGPVKPDLLSSSLLIEPKFVLSLDDPADDWLGLAVAFIYLARLRVIAGRVRCAGPRQSVWSRTLSVAALEIDQAVGTDT